MKKEIYILLILLGIVALSFGQEWTSTTSPDTVIIVISVRMIGASWTFDDGGTGAENTTSAIFSFSTVADTFGASGDVSIHPCDIIHRVFWLENTGGITLDFNTYFDETRTGPTWSHDNSNITCGTINAIDTIGGAYSFELSDGDSLTPASPSFIVLPEDSVGSVDELENLWAEDPDNLGDSVWASQADQREYHLEYVMPISSTDTLEQHFYSVIIGKISD